MDQNLLLDIISIYGGTIIHELTILGYRLEPFGCQGFDS